MTTPQTENGYTRIANEIVEALCRTNLSPYESRFLWCLFRKTYGFNKKEDWIPLSQIVDITGMHKSHVSRSKSKLLERNIVTQTGNKIAFNKIYAQWKELPKQVTHIKLPKQVTTVTQTGNAELPKQAHSKDNASKDNTQKTPSSTRKGPNPGVQSIMDAMRECFGELDDSEAKNRQYAWNLLKKAGGKSEPCVALIRAAAKHDFWGHKITKVEHIYKSTKRIAQDLRESGNAAPKIISI